MFPIAHDRRRAGDRKPYRRFEEHSDNEVRENQPVSGTLLGRRRSPVSRAETLGVGDAAPKLNVKSFVKGEPVSAFEPGKNYVVEFWATWCGPCKTSIPHLTELQKKNPGVTFIGVSIWEDDQEQVKPFVDEMGDKMAYRVAVDSIPDKEKADEGAMAKTWMTAADQNGIPTAFIVNKEGKIAWIGHPMDDRQTPREDCRGQLGLDGGRGRKAQCR